MLGLYIVYMHTKFDYYSFSRSRDMADAHQNLNCLRDLTTPHSGAICHPRLALTTVNLLPNLKSIFPPTTKIWRAIHNIENGVVWGI